MFSALQALPPTMFTYPNPWQPTAGNAVMPPYYGAIRPPKQPMPLSQQCAWSFQFYCVPRTKVDNPERRLRRLVPKPCFAKCQGVVVSSKTTSFISVRILKTRDTQPGLQGVDPPHMSGVYAPRTSFPSAPRKEGGGMKEFYFCAIFWKYIFSQLFFIILRKQNFCIILRHHTTSNVELGSPKRKFPSGVGEPGPTYSSVVQV